MTDITLTNKQRHWLEHIERAEAQNQSLSAYAKQHGLNLKLLYNMKHVLRRKGVLIQPTAKDALLPVQVVSPWRPPSCRVCLPNGVVVELPPDLTGDGLTHLLTAASQLS